MYGKYYTYKSFYKIYKGLYRYWNHRNVKRDLERQIVYVR